MSSSKQLPICPFELLMLLAENQEGLAVALLLQMQVGNRREGKLAADHEFVVCKFAEKWRERARE